MRNLFIILLSAVSISIGAEQVKLALLQPRIAEGSDACLSIEINMVRGELRKAFGWQSDFQVLTRTDVDAMLKEHGFQQSGMVADAQRRQVGVMTGAQYICVSNITKYKTQLYIEAYLVDIETGQMTNPASQFANIENNDYSQLQAPCNELAKEMLGELGERPKSSGIIGGTKGLPIGYVDLGLPSGTLWKSENEDCGLINYAKAYSFYGDNLPTKEQWEELQSNCLWVWQGNGYIVKGKNGESLFLPSAGAQDCDGTIKGIGSDGGYWSSTHDDSDRATGLGFYSGGVVIYTSRRCYGRSIRLIAK